MDTIKLFCENWLWIFFGCYVLVQKLKAFDGSQILSFSDRVEMLKQDQIIEDIYVPMIARMMIGLSKKECLDILKKAQESAKTNNDLIFMDHFIPAYYDITLGYKLKDFTVSYETKKQVAFHESGHAIGYIYQQSEFLVHSISIVPCKNIMGFVHPIPIKEMIPSTISFYENEVKINLSGAIAEQIFGLPDGKIIDKDTGYIDLLSRVHIQSDFEKVRNNIMLIMILQQHPMIYLCKKKSLSDSDLAQVNEAMHDIIKVYYEQAYDLIFNHKEKVEIIAQALLEKETLQSQQIYELLGMDKLKYDFET